MLGLFKTKVESFLNHADDCLLYLRTEGPGREINGHNLTQCREGNKPTTSVQENQLSALQTQRSFTDSFAKEENEQEAKGSSRTKILDFKERLD